MGLQQMVLGSAGIPPITCDVFTYSSGSAQSWQGNRCLHGYSETSVDSGGSPPSGQGYYSAVEYFGIAACSNSADFGDQGSGEWRGQACTNMLSNRTRCCAAGGYSNAISKKIEYFTVATLGNASDVGNMIKESYNNGGCSNGTRGVITGIGDSNRNPNNTVMDYFTIANNNNASDFGDNTKYMDQRAGGVSNGTRGVFANGQHANFDSMNIHLQYITIASTGDSDPFGNLETMRKNFGSCDNGSRGVWMGGNYSIKYNIIDYVTIATTSDTTDFGDLSIAQTYASAASNGIRGVKTGGHTGSARIADIEFITIATTSDAGDYADLLVAQNSGAAGSGD